MADKIFLHLNSNWSLAYDSLQWILQRRGSIDKRTGNCCWHGESFISSNRDILVLTLREKGIVPDLGKLEEVKALPSKEWYAHVKGRAGATVRRIAEHPTKPLKCRRGGGLR